MIVMNGGQRNGTNAKYGESKTTRIMMATVPHVTSGLGLRKFQAHGFLLTRVYKVCSLSISYPVPLRHPIYEQVKSEI